MDNKKMATITLVAAGVLALALICLLVAIFGGAGVQTPSATTGQTQLSTETGTAETENSTKGTVPEEATTAPTSTVEPGGTGKLPTPNTENNQQGGTQQGGQSSDVPAIEVEKPNADKDQDPDGEEEVPTEKPGDKETDTTQPSQGNDPTEPSEESKPQTPPLNADDEYDAEISLDEILGGGK